MPATAMPPNGRVVIPRRLRDGLTFHRVVKGFMIQGGEVSRPVAPLTMKKVTIRP